MGGHKGSIIAAVALLVACAAPATADLNVTALCLLVSSGNYVASQSDCSTYYQCQGSSYTTLSCPTGYYFDKNTQQCTGSVPSTCTSNTNPCQGKAVGTFAASSSSCGGYYYCGAAGAVSGSCPTGENFNPTTMACVYKNNYPCSESSSSDSLSVSVALNLCNLIRDGLYFGSPTNCSGWNYCQDNVLHSGTCEAGRVFNVQAVNCGYKTSSSCSQVTNDASLTGVITPSTCTTAGSMIAATACNQYYMCTASLSYQLMTCPSGYYYDTPSKSCVTRMNARNDCDRCVGTTASFVNAYSASNCSDYLYCSNGVQKAVESCPTNYYFNEVYGGCVSGVEPKFLCCNPTGSNGTDTSTSGSSSGNSTDTSSGSSSTGNSTDTSSSGSSSTSTGGSTDTSSSGTSSGSSSSSTGSSTDTSSGSSTDTSSKTDTSSGSSSTSTGTSTDTSSKTDTSSGSSSTSTGTSTDTSSKTDTSSGSSSTSTGTSTGTDTSAKTT